MLRKSDTSNCERMNTFDINAERGLQRNRHIRGVEQPDRVPLCPCNLLLLTGIPMQNPQMLVAMNNLTPDLSLQAVALLEELVEYEPREMTRTRTVSD